MNFPILSAIILIPLIGALFIFITKGNSKNVEKNSKYLAIFSSSSNFLLTLFLQEVVGWSKVSRYIYLVVKLPLG